MLRGDPGAGKTALLDYAAVQATGLSVLRVRGVESERELPFSSLYDLVRPRIETLESLPEVQATALRGALALAPPLVDGRLAVSAATLGFLAAVAEPSGLLVLVDDAHCLDASSAEALLFAGRRLEAEGVTIVFAVRTGKRSAFDDAGFEELFVNALDGADRAQPVALSRLTPQEFQVALMVGSGATNTEAAKALFVSHKTIEFHLHNTYRKLGVRSRTELAALMAGAGKIATTVTAAFTDLSWLLQLAGTS